MMERQSLEEALDRLEQIARSLEGGEIELEQSLAMYDRIYSEVGEFLQRLVAKHGHVVGRPPLHERPCRAPSAPFASSPTPPTPLLSTASG